MFFFSRICSVIPPEFSVVVLSLIPAKVSPGRPAKNDPGICSGIHLLHPVLFEEFSQEIRSQIPPETYF